MYHQIIVSTFHQGFDPIYLRFRPKRKETDTQQGTSRKTIPSTSRFPLLQPFSLGISLPSSVIYSECLSEVAPYPLTMRGTKSSTKRRGKFKVQQTGLVSSHGHCRLESSLKIVKLRVQGITRCSAHLDGLSNRSLVTPRIPHSMLYCSGAYRVHRPLQLRPSLLLHPYTSDGEEPKLYKSPR